MLRAGVLWNLVAILVDWAKTDYFFLPSAAEFACGCLAFAALACACFALAALLAALIMIRLGAWYKVRLQYVVKHPQKTPGLNTHISKRAKYGALAILILLVFSKYFYTSCITSYFTFFLTYLEY